MTTRRDVGFLRALSSVRFGQLWPEGVLAFVFGVSAALWGIDALDQTARAALLGDLLVVLAALLGIVFAALSVSVSLMSDDLIRWLNTSNEGLLQFMRPYVFAIGLQISALVLAVGYRAFGSAVSSIVEHWGFGIALTLSLYALFDVMALTRSVLMQAVLRSKGVELADLETEVAAKAGHARH